MQKVFWALVAVDAGLFLFLLIATLKQRGPADGGREMALFFGVLLPGAAVALAVVFYVLSSSTTWRLVAFLVVATPLLFIAAVHARSAYIDYSAGGASRGLECLRRVEPSKTSKVDVYGTRRDLIGKPCLRIVVRE